jgi:hypothetical protein
MPYHQRPLDPRRTRREPSTNPVIRPLGSPLQPRSAVVLRGSLRRGGSHQAQRHPPTFSGTVALVFGHLTSRLVWTTDLDITRDSVMGTQWRRSVSGSEFGTCLTQLLREGRGP